MEFKRTSIPDVVVIEPKVFGDARGFFMETYHASRYLEYGIPEHFVQDNHSGSRKGILRGIHYQIRQPQGKLVRVVAGQVFDLAVDLRRSSPTFGHWMGEILSAENRRQLWMPPGFGHAFYVLSEWAEVLYKASDYYAPEWERSLLWNDAQLGIAWPLVDGELPLLSPKDANAKTLQEAELFD